MRDRIRALAAISGFTLAALGLAGVAAPATTRAAAAMRPAEGRPATGPLSIQVGRPVTTSPRRSDRSLQSPPSDTECEIIFEAEQCFNPTDIKRAYGLDKLAKGDEGKGQTIVIVDSYGSPTIAADLAVFDRGYKLPAPPSLEVLSPLGHVKFNPNNETEDGWAEEATLDVEWSHAMAPLARIVLLTSPVAETEGTVGLGDFLELEQYALNHNLGHIISQSWAATENTLETKAGTKLVAEFERFYARADRHHVTILGSAGDDGTQNPSNGAGTKFYSFPTVNFPASSPLVTAVGGTTLTTKKSVWSSEVVWNDGPGGGAGGGGISQLFAEPSYQKSLPHSVQVELGGHRGLPDISWNADPDTAILVYTSFVPGEAGYGPIGGTSEGSPQWAGYIADIDQARGNPIGFLNPILYSLASPAEKSFHDITKGNNAYGGVKGYSATTGWDPASGLGTPFGAQLNKALIAARATT